MKTEIPEMPKEVQEKFDKLSDKNKHLVNELIQFLLEKQKKDGRPSD